MAFVICNEPVGFEYPGQLCGLESGHEGPHCFGQVPVDTKLNDDSVAAFTPDMPPSDPSMPVYVSDDPNDASFVDVCENPNCRICNVPKSR